MHLVFATSIVPAGAPRSGYEIANRAILDAMRRAGVKVTVLGFSLPGSVEPAPDTVVLGSLDVRTDSAGVARKAKWLATALSRGMTFASAKLRVVSVDAVQNLLSRLEPIDGYVLNSVQLAAAYPEVFADKPALYVAHNVEYRSAEENAEAADGLAERLMYRREAKLLRSIEADLCRRARFVFTLAEEDRRLLAIASDVRSAALPLVTTDAAPAPRRRRETEFDATLIGTWTWAPNRIGLDWFLGEVLPLMGPGFSLAIAGRAPADLPSRYPGVRFVGAVDDAVEFVRRGKVVPLVSRAGTGVQLKSIETFELGLPSVATPRSLRGIAGVPANCVVAEDPRVFARALRDAVSGAAKDLDGRHFHAAQKRMLDQEIRRGLMQFGFVLERDAA